LSLTTASRHWVIASTEIVVVGLPFSAFKVLTGVAAAGLPSLGVVGSLLIGLGALDSLINVVNLGSFVLRRRPATDVCVSDFVVRRLAPEDDLGVALDVFVSFGLVAVVVGLGLIARMPSWALPIWNVAVVLNVLGAGVGRLYGALRQRGVRS
jgi:hypothetical protein